LTLKNQILIIDSGNQVETVILLFSPLSFVNDLDQVYTFHYFLKPFYKKEYYQYFTPFVRQQIKKIPFYRFSQVPHILTSTWAPKLPARVPINYGFFSPISKEYLVKIKQLAEQNKIKLKFVPTPTRISKKKQIQRINRNNFPQHGLHADFEAFFNNVIYLDDNLFIDDLHLEKPSVYTDLYLEKYIN